VTEIIECALDAVIAPSWIVTGHTQQEFNNFLGNRWAPEFLAALAVILLPGYQFTMPTKYGARGHDGGDFLQHLATQHLSFDG
jgi:hypothetical protein